MIKNYWGVWVDTEVAIPCVYQNNYVTWLDDEMWHGCSVQLGYEHFQEELDEERDAYEALLMEDLILSASDVDLKLDLFDIEHEDDEQDPCTILIGSWRKANEDETPDYDGYIIVETEEPGYAAIVHETDTHVMWSTKTIRRGLCSPCALGQAYFNTPGPFLCYAMPDDVLGEDFEYAEDDNYPLRDK